MSAIMHDVIHGMSREPNLIVELVSLGHSCLPHGSMRHWNLQRKIKHYVTLEQAAAKDKLWRKMYDIIYGLQTEVSLSRAARERSGATV